MKKFLFTALFAFIGSVVFSQERIAVFPFEDMDNVLSRNESIFFYRQFSNEFATRMANRFVVPRQEVERLINTEMAFQLSDFSAREKTAEMNQVLNGTQILSGIIGKVGNGIAISVSLYTYPNLRQLPGGVDLRVANKDELFSKIPELVQRMQDRIADTAQPIPEGLKYEVVDNKSFTITGYTGTATTVNIPSRIAGLPVTTIGEGAFSDCDSLTSVTIPSSVTSIGENAFAYTGLINVAIPSSVMAIGYATFLYCTSLTSVTIPSSVMSIDETAFAQCHNLISITVDNRNPVYASIDGVLFDKKIQTLLLYPKGRNQRTYVIPSSVTTIEQGAFFGCGSLTSVTIPSSVTSIGGNTFYDCSSLTNITVENSNPAYASIDGVLFDKNIRTLIRYPQGRNPGAYVIPSSVTTIGRNAFMSCEITSITIPSSVMSIEYGALSYCGWLTSVTIPSSVTSIGDRAFDGCGSLTSVTLSRRTQVGESAFDQRVRITYRD